MKRILSILAIGTVLVLGSSAINTASAGGNIHHRGRTSGFFKRVAQSQTVKHVEKKCCKKVEKKKCEK